jgi:hypothetical protein
MFTFFQELSVGVGERKGDGRCVGVKRGEEREVCGGKVGKVDVRGGGERVSCIFDTLK